MSSEVTSKEYWDQYWGEGEIKHPKYNVNQGLFHSYKLLLEDCFEKARQRLNVDRLQIIDCGCGEGLMLRFIAEQFENVDVYGIEYSDAIGKAERMAVDLDLSFNLIRGDLLKEWESQYLNKFDVVLSLGLIEHFEDPGEILAQMIKVLKPGGALVTIVPNFNGLFHVLWQLYDKANYAYHIPISHNELSVLHQQSGLNEVAFYTLGLPTVPGVHNASSIGERIVRRVTMVVNQYILRRIFPRRQKNILKRYPMVSTVACVGIK